MTRSIRSRVAAALAASLIALGAAAPARSAPVAAGLEKAAPAHTVDVRHRRHGGGAALAFGLGAIAGAAIAGAGRPRYYDHGYYRPAPRYYYYDSPRVYYAPRRVYRRHYYAPPRYYRYHRIPPHTGY